MFGVLVLQDVLIQKSNENPDLHDMPPFEMWFKSLEEGEQKML